MSSYLIPLWKDSPVLRVLVPYALALICSDGISIPGKLFLLLFIFFLCLNGLFFLIPVHLKFRWRKMIGLSLLTLCFLFGIIMHQNNSTSSQKWWYGHYIRPDAILLLTVQSAPEYKSKTIKCYAEVIAVESQKLSHSTKGKILVYFPMDSLSQNIKYGDTVIVVNKLQKIPTPKNLGDFDYHAFLKRRNIYHQLFLKPTDFQIKSIHHKPLFSYLIDLKNAILRAINKHVNGFEEKGIAEALLIGYKEHLNPELTKTYTNTGVVHIIAISGLHLGLIYMVLIWLADRIPILKRFHLMKSILIITSLWIFAILTGASASVLRSAVMFTFIALGKLLSRDSSMVNSLAGSALMLLCYDPFLLWDVGFQLSYLAIIGIITFQGLVYRCFNKLPFLLDSIWKLTSITISAQVFTFPVCIYYFQQFPNYFLISNLIAVPLSTIILFQELFLILFSGLESVSHFAGIVVEYSIHWMNLALRFINQLPFAVTDNIPGDIFVVMSMYVMLTAIVYFQRNKSILNLYVLLTTFLFLSFSISACSIRLQHHSAIIVYAVKKHFALDVISGRNVISYTDSSILQNIKVLKETTGPTKKRFSIPSGSWYFIHDSMKLISCNKKKLLLIEGSVQIKAAAKNLPVDVLVVSQVSVSTLEHYLEKVIPDMVVASNFESNYQQKLCSAYAQAHGIKYFDVQQNGAFYLNCSKD